MEHWTKMSKEDGILSDHEIQICIYRYIKGKYYNYQKNTRDNNSVQSLIPGKMYIEHYHQQQY